jgi:hypothetical protein
MFKNAAALIEIAKKTPPAIDYFYLPPSPQYVPDVALKKTHHNREFWFSVISLRNLSSKVLTNIRIKLPLLPKYDPVIGPPLAVVSGVATYLPHVHEIQIARLDPRERIYVEVFLSSVECENFTEPLVIIDDQLLSRGMRTVGFFKSRPREILVYTLPLLAIFAALFGMVYMAYEYSSFNPKTKVIRDALATGSRCVLKAYEKSAVNELLLDKHSLGEWNLLQINKVSKRQDLLKQDHVVVCE